MTTYSSNLRLNLIGSGAEAGTWGNTTNYNLGTLVEGAVAGLAEVTVTSTSQALTANNGTADESRDAILKLTVSGVATQFNIYAPPSSKTYIVWNTSAYDARFYNSTVIGNTTPASGTYATVAAGRKAVLFTDGTAFYLVSSDAGTVSSVDVSGGTTGLTFSGGPITSSGTMTMTGTLAIANGGTGQTTANAALNAFLPSQTSNSGKYLTTDGTNTSWATAVSSFSAGTTGLTPSTATTGAVTLGGTLAVANGGTGVTTSTGSGANVLGTSPTISSATLSAPTITGGTINGLTTTSLGSNGYGSKTISTSAPAGGSNGDIWYKV